MGFQISVACPEPYSRDFSESLKKNAFSIFFPGYFSFSLSWDPMGTKTSKRYSSLKSLFSIFKLFLNFHKSTVLGVFNFELTIFRDFFFFFVNMGHYGSKNFKTLVLRQITFIFFQTSAEFSSQWSSKKYCSEFLNFEFTIVFENFKFTIVPYGETER